MAGADQDLGEDRGAAGEAMAVSGSQKDQARAGPAAAAAQGLPCQAQDLRLLRIRRAASEGIHQGRENTLAITTSM